MKRKMLSAITLTLLLIGMLTLAFNIQPVKASGTIWIRGDGSVDPPTGPISSLDNVTYTLTDNIMTYGDGIIIERDNIIFDGKGYTVQGTGKETESPIGIILSGYWKSPPESVYNITIKNVKIKLFGIGIDVDASSSTLYGNNITNNNVGIRLEGGSNNNISANHIASHLDGGIELYYGSNNTLIGNELTNNGLSINAAIYLWESSNNTLIGNKMTNNKEGIELDFSSGNTISGNKIANNHDGMFLAGSSNNSVYHNCFLNNEQQVHDYSQGLPICPPSINVWDNGYPLGGNYWSDYVGVDVRSGLGQGLPGSDGIGDTPYIIDANNTDRYPLINPYGAPPLPTYSLTITTTVGGTTDPALGTYSYTANSTVQVTAIPEANYLFDYWELDSVNVGSANPYSVYMDKNHILKAVFSPIPPPLSASISPLSVSILVGQSVTFTSTVSGGYTPYGYQWYLNGNPVSGATANTWMFTPTTGGIYYVHLKVTDDKGNTAQSDAARITVATVPVGGYSVPIQLPTTAKPATINIALLMILTATFIIIKRKTKRKH